MLVLMSIERCKARGTGNIFYKLYCSDDYNHGGWVAGSPLKVVAVSEKTLNKALGDDIITNAPFKCGCYVYVMYNEFGYCNYVRFYTEEQRKERQEQQNSYIVPTPASSADVPLPADVPSADGAEPYPF